MLTARYPLTIPYRSISRRNLRSSQTDTRNSDSEANARLPLENETSITTPKVVAERPAPPKTTHEAEALAATLLFAIVATVALISIRYLSFTNLIPETVQLTTWDLVQWMESLH